jgi:hypothetical protein
MFENKRTGAKAKELRGYDSESEADAKRRLQAAGWVFDGMDVTFDESTKIFSYADPKMETKVPAVIGDE